MMNDSSQVSRWLTKTIAEYLTVPVEHVDSSSPFTEYGLDSVYAVNLSGEIEDQFGIQLDPTAAWDYPTIDELAEFVAAEMDRAGVR